MTRNRWIVLIVLFALVVGGLLLATQPDGIFNQTKPVGCTDPVGVPNATVDTGHGMAVCWQLTDGSYHWVMNTPVDYTPIPQPAWCDPSTIHPSAEGEIDPTKGLILPAAGETHLEWWIPGANAPEEGIWRILAGQTLTVSKGIKGHFWQFPPGTPLDCLNADWANGLANYKAKPQHAGMTEAQLVILPPGNLIQVK